MFKKIIVYIRLFLGLNSINTRRIIKNDEQAQAQAPASKTKKD